MQGQFELPLIYQLIAVFLLAITGAMVAVERKYDIAGLFALAFVAGASGAIIRDGLFLAKIPIIIQEWQYLVAITLGAVVALFFMSYLKKFTTIFVIVDALGLAIFAMISTQMALDINLNVLAALLVGLTGAVIGGFLRDIFTGREALLLKPGQYYISAALAGIILFLILSYYLDVNAQLAAILGIILTFAIRIMSYFFNWQTSAVTDLPHKISGNKEKF